MNASAVPGFDLQLKNYTISLRVANSPASHGRCFLSKTFTITNDPALMASFAHIIALISTLLKQMIEASVSCSIQSLKDFQTQTVSYVEKNSVNVALREQQEAYFVSRSLLEATVLLADLPASTIAKMAPFYDLRALFSKNAKGIKQPEILFVNHMKQALFLQRKLFVSVSKIVTILTVLSSVEKEIFNAGGRFTSIDESRLSLRYSECENLSFDELAYYLHVVRLLKALSIGVAIEARLARLFTEIAKAKAAGLFDEKLEKFLCNTIYLQLINQKRMKAEQKLPLYLLIFSQIEQKWASHTPTDSSAAKIFSQQQLLLKRIAPFSCIMDCRKIFFQTLQRNGKATDYEMISEAVLHAAVKRLEHISQLQPFLTQFRQDLAQDNALYDNIEAFCRRQVDNSKHDKLQLTRDLHSMRIEYLRPPTFQLQDEKVYKKVSTSDFCKLLAKSEQPFVLPTFILQEEPKPTVELVSQTLALKLDDPPPVAEKKMIYHPRVLRWFSPTPENDPFVHDPQYNKRTYDKVVKRWIIAQHNFAIAVDAYAMRYGIRHDNALYLVGEMTLHNETRKGLFVYAANADGVTYHRYFSSKNTADILSEYLMRGYYELDFPRLQSLPETELKASDILLDDNSSITSETEYLISIRDPKNEASVRLCKLI